jgi:hypothetical protein
MKAIILPATGSTHIHHSKIKLSKTLLYLFVFSNQFVFAQYINYDKIDDFDAFRKINASIENRTKLIPFYENILKSNQIAANFDLNCTVNLKNNTKDTYIKFSLGLGQIRCFNDSKIILLFEEGQQTTLKQKSDIICGQGVHISYELLESDLYYLLNYKLKKVRLYTTEGYIDSDIKSSKTQKIIDTFTLFKMTIPQ